MGPETMDRASRFESRTKRVLVLFAALALASLSCQNSPKERPSAPLLQGVVFDLDKTPVAGALIELRGEGLRLSAITDAQGRFTFDAVKIGDYDIQFSKPMYEKLERRIRLSDVTEVLYIQASGYWQLLDAALSALGAKDLGRAEEYLNRASSIQEKSSTSLFLEGVLAEKRGDYAVAIHKLEAASAIDSRSPYLWLYLADLCERSGSDPAKAIAALEKYLELRDDPAAAARVDGLRSRGASKN
jgi:tetratricopeptide (TPR) repeat protein